MPANRAEQKLGGDNQVHSHEIYGLKSGLIWANVRTPLQILSHNLHYFIIK